MADDIAKVQPKVTYAQAPHLFRNLGGKRFEDVVGQVGAGPEAAHGVARAPPTPTSTATATSTWWSPPTTARRVLLRNDGGNRNRWLRVRLVGTKSNRDGIGARVTVTLPAGAKQWAVVKTGSSYCSQSELPLTFGLGAAPGVRVGRGGLAQRPGGSPGRPGRPAGPRRLAGAPRAREDTVTRSRPWPRRRQRRSAPMLSAPFGPLAASSSPRRGMPPGVRLSAAASPWLRTRRAGTEPTREAAYRANNLGVALLEQYRFADGGRAVQEGAWPSTRSSPRRRSTWRSASSTCPTWRRRSGRRRRAAALAPGRAPAALRAGPDRAPGEPARGRGARASARCGPRIPRDVGRQREPRPGAPAAAALRRGHPAARGRGQGRALQRDRDLQPGVALTRAGRRDEGAAVTKRFQELRESLYKTQFGQTYLEQGRYAEALASTGAEAGARGRGGARRRLRRRRRRRFRPTCAAARPVSGGRPSLDADGDGQLDLAAWPAPDGVRLLRNEGGRFADATAAAGLGRVRGAGGRRRRPRQRRQGRPAAARRPWRLLPQRRRRRFKDAGGGRVCRRTRPPPSPPWPTSTTTATSTSCWGPRGGAGRSFLRNNGDLTFTDVTAESKLGARGPATALVATDFDNRRDLDLFVARPGGRRLLFKNRRDGTFEDVAAERRPRRRPAPRRWRRATSTRTASPTSSWPGSKEAWLVALGRPGQRSSRRRARSGRRRAAAAALFVDVDADGLLDLVVAGAYGLRCFRNLGQRLRASSAAAATGPGAARPASPPPTSTRTATWTWWSRAPTARCACCATTAATGTARCAWPSPAG